MTDLPSDTEPVDPQPLTLKVVKDYRELPPQLLSDGETLRAILDELKAIRAVLDAARV